MRPRAIIREAWRNVVSGTARTGTLIVLSSFLSLALASADVTTIVQTLNRAQEFNVSGASVLIVSAPGQIDGTVCERLSEVPGVLGAGSLRNLEDRVVPSALPSAPIPMADVSTGLSRLLGAKITRSGVLLGPEVATTFGAHRIRSLATPTMSVPIGGTYTYPDDGRRTGLSYSILRPVEANDTFDECWMQVWPSNEMLSKLIFTTVEPGSTGIAKPEISQLNSTLGRSFDVVSELDRRVTRTAAPLAAALALAIGFFGMFVRRLSLASALHAGVSRRSLLGIVALEASVYLTISAALSIGVAAAFLGANHFPEYGTLVMSVTRVAVCSFLGGIAGVGIGLLMARERHLFRYFKGR